MGANSRLGAYSNKYGIANNTPACRCFESCEDNKLFAIASPKARIQPRGRCLSLRKTCTQEQKWALGSHPGTHFHALSTLGARESVPGYWYKIVFNSHLEYPTGDCVLSVHSYSM